MKRSAMKRTRMRRKRKAPPPLPVYKAYRDNEPPDEILFYLGCRVMDRGRLRMDGRKWERAANVHHIFNLGGRHDEICNLIGVNFIAHNGRHFGVNNEGRQLTVLALMAKFKKCETLIAPDEFNLFTLWKCAGQYLTPLVESVTFADSSLEALRRSLLGVLEGIEQGRER